MMNGSKFADFEFIKEIITKPMPKVWRVQQKKNAGNQSSNTKQDKNHQQTIDKENSIWTINHPPCNVRHSDHFLSGWAGSCNLYMQSVIVQSYHCHNVRWSSSIQIFLSSYWGTHALISFVESVRKLIKNGGSDMLKKTAFAGIGKMPIGKKFPINVRALRVVVNINWYWSYWEY